MKFTDKKYLHLEDVNGNKIYETIIHPHQLGFDDSYEDIVLELKINIDNSIDLNFDNNTLNDLNSNISNNRIKACKTKQDSMLYTFKKQLLKYPYPTDELKLKFK